MTVPPAPGSRPLQSARWTRRRESRTAAWVPLALLVGSSWVPLACGGGSPRTQGPETSVEEPPPETPVPTGAVRRAEVDAVLNAGLPAFLQGITLEPVSQGERFLGFRILALYPGDPRFADAPVRPGDVVTAVNGLPIERPEQAHAVWEGLRVASEIAIALIRDGEPTEVRLAIVE